LTLSNVALSRLKLPPSVDLNAFGQRAKHARALSDVVRAQHGLPRASAVQLAIEMAEIVGETINDRDTGRYLRGESVPGSLVRQWGFAMVLGVDPGWLYFGAESQAPAPTLDAPSPMGIATQPVTRAAEHPPTGVARLGGKEVPERGPPKRRKRSNG
jgi:hypothetical protein